MGETSEWLEAHGGPGMVLCGRTGNFVADTALCSDCPRKLCMNLPGSEPCDECRAECPDWQPDEPNPLD